MSYNAQILEVSKSYLGLEEWPGAKRSNPDVERLFEASGFPGLTDDVPWCAAFVGAVLGEIGVAGSGSLMARSYAKWGQNVPLIEAQPGDVVVFARGAPPAGHVAFFLRFDGSDRVIVRGGNQSNKVTDASYPVSSIVAIRRADPSEKQGRATLRLGNHGAFVLDLQTQLALLGYFAGKKDGDFGPLTQAAVLAFQGDNGLETDGVVGNRTWAALANAQPKPKRDVDADDLRNRGSETIKASDSINITTVVAGVTTALPAIKDSVDQANGVLPVLTTMVTDHWPALVVIVLLALAYAWSKKIADERVKAAQEGRNLSK